MLGRHNVGQKIQRLGVAMVEARVFHRNAVHRRRTQALFLGLYHNPQVHRRAFGKRMAAMRRTARYLPIHEMIGAIHLGNQVGKQLEQFIGGNARVDFHVGAAVEEALQVVFGEHHYAIKRHGCIVDAVAVEAHAVEEGNLQLFQEPGFAVVIADVLHNASLAQRRPGQLP